MLKSDEGPLRPRAFPFFVDGIAIGSRAEPMYAAG
jgi:hypothetical protein